MTCLSFRSSRPARAAAAAATRLFPATSHLLLPLRSSHLPAPAKETKFIRSEITEYLFLFLSFVRLLHVLSNYMKGFSRNYKKNMIKRQAHNVTVR